MFKKTIAIALFGWLAVSVSAQAQGFVIGKALRTECYESALFGSDSTHALGECDKALEVEMMSREHRAATHVNRGIIHMNRDDTAKALRDFARSEALMPSMAETYINRGGLYLRLNRAEDAIEEFDRALALEPREAHIAYHGRAMARERLDDLPNAYRDYKRALESRPGWAPARIELERFEVVETG